MTTTPKPKPPGSRTFASLQAYLKANKLTTREFAKKLGVHHTTVSLLAHRKRAARFKLAERLSKITGVPLKVLATRPAHRRRKKGA